MSIAQSLLNIVLEEGRKHRLKKVKKINLHVGALSAVVPDSLKFCFDLLAQSTIACGASLEIEMVPIIARCSECKEPFEVEDHVYLCPHCGQPSLELISGRELSLTSIEGETGDTDDADEDSSSAKYPAG
ncbi:MAG: hydrogenase maturation nickel metallochaperone HypA [Desulforhabdus sp.]|jgi:hydrogenase nickel incorporation protein HypA/HybF|nr:hydrogenase maturation nickel metallochaperone HypA [Desulforhabdus sp.]